MYEPNGIIQDNSEYLFPWTAMVFRENELKENIVEYSVGALISYRHVFIDALSISFVNNVSDIFNPKADEIRIAFGIEDMSMVTRDTSFSEASNLIIHPDHVLGIPIKANIAVIILKEPVVFSRKVFPVCLWDLMLPLKDFTGKTVHGVLYEGQSSKTKKLTNGLIKDLNQCPANYKYILRNVKDKSKYFCAGGESNATLCSGENTSMFMKQGNFWYLYATLAYREISIKHKSCDNNKPSMFEALNSYVKWIQNIVITM